MLNESNLHPYQRHAVDHLIQYPEACLFLSCGLGKTISTLTAINQLIYNLCEVEKVLIIAPLRVARDVWAAEAANWQHTTHLRFSLILGTEKQRKEALKVKADCYVINRELVPWLIAILGGAWPFDLVVADELSSFKSQKAVRFKALRRVRPLVSRFIGLTATPCSNSMIDLWSQMYLVDKGLRLGKTKTGFQEAFFKAPYRVNGIPVSDYEIKAGCADQITEKIKDICLSMSAKDYLDLPERVDIVTDVKLSPPIMQAYLDFEKTCVLSMFEGKEVSAVSAVALRGKLLQFANGAVYHEDHSFSEVHNEKMDALAEMVEAANGNPILVAYTFKSDVVRIMQHHRHLKPYVLSSTADMANWNAKKIPYALAHPASLGHGLNLQKGGHLFGWFGRPDSLELYLQFLGRLDRQGQTDAVISNSLACRGTMDYRVIESSDSKYAGQEYLLNAVKALVKKYIG